MDNYSAFLAPEVAINCLMALFCGVCPRNDVLKGKPRNWDSEVHECENNKIWTEQILIIKESCSAKINSRLLAEWLVTS